MQEGYVRALASLHRFRGQASLSKWLTRIVINEALGRRRSRRPTIELAAIDGTRVKKDDDVAGTMTRHRFQDNLENAAARAEVRRIIERAVDNCPSRSASSSCFGRSRD